MIRLASAGFAWMADANPVFGVGYFRRFFAALAAALKMWL